MYAPLSAYKPSTLAKILAALTQDAAENGASSLVRNDITTFYDALRINCGDDAGEYMTKAGVISKELPQQVSA